MLIPYFFIGLVDGVWDLHIVLAILSSKLMFNIIIIYFNCILWMTVE